ncbi:unnamed protein product, partial [Prorocentrum cordatum]
GSSAARRGGARHRITMEASVALAGLRPLLGEVLAAGAPRHLLRLRLRRGALHLRRRDASVLERSARTRVRGLASWDLFLLLLLLLLLFDFRLLSSYLLLPPLLRSVHRGSYRWHRGALRTSA